MKKVIIPIFFTIFYLSSCMTVKEVPADKAMAYPPDDIITESLFADKDASISEENIQVLLDGGTYILPSNLRVAIVNLDNGQLIKRRYVWNDEDYLSSRQKYLATMTNNLNQHRRVKKVSLVPEMMMAAKPTFTTIREAAVRLQADIVLVYSIKGGTYSRYKAFSSDEYKAFATTQIMIMDVRTGLVPFTTVVTENYLSKKQKSDFNGSEAEKRTQEEAVALTLTKVCNEINMFLDEDNRSE